MAAPILDRSGSGAGQPDALIDRYQQQQPAVRAQLAVVEGRLNVLSADAAELKRVGARLGCRPCKIQALIACDSTGT